MEIKLFLTSLPLNPGVKGTPSQGYVGNHWVDSLVNKVSARSLSSIMGPDLRGELTHFFVPKVKRNFDGDRRQHHKHQEQILPPLHSPEEYPIFCSIDDKDTFEESTLSPQPIPGVLLNGTPWEVLTSLYFGLWPTLTVLYHRQDVPYVNLLTGKAKGNFKDLGSSYLH